MPRQPVDDPPPLNPLTNFPYAVRAFPFDWLRQFAGLAPGDRQSGSDIPKDQPNRVE